MIRKNRKQRKSVHRKEKAIDDKPSARMTWRVVVWSALSAVIAAFLVNFFSATFSIFESRLHISSRPRPPTIVDLRREGDRNEFLVRLEQEFTNYGLRPGRIADVKLVSSTLEEVFSAKLLYLDRGDIGFLRSKVIKAEILLSHGRQSPKRNWIWYAYYYDETGREIGYVGSLLEKVN